MSARVIVGGVLCVGVLVQGAPTLADPGSTWSDQDSGEVGAAAGESTSGGAAESLAQTGAEPTCEWEIVTWRQLSDSEKADLPTEKPTDGYLKAKDGIDPHDEIRRDAEHGGYTDQTAQFTEALYRRTCSDGSVDEFWISDGVDEDDLIDDAYQQVVAQLPSPSMNMNPDPSVGGIVNIGLWLAVDDPGVVSITAQVGPTWATVTAQYESTTWDMGNGDIEECPGIGTPIVDVDDPDEGPCGYTYRWPSAPKFTGTEDLAYHNSVTGHWSITYATSSGRSGSLDPIDRNTEYTYQVREIQTVYSAGNE